MRSSAPFDGAQGDRFKISNGNQRPFVLSLVEASTVWEQLTADTLRWDKQIKFKEEARHLWLMTW